MWNPFKSKKENTELPTVFEEKHDYELMQVEKHVPDIPADLFLDEVTPADATLEVAKLATDVAKQAIDVYRTSKQVEQNIAAIRAASDVQLAHISKKFEFCKTALEHVFQDRHSALSAHYAVLGTAMKSNDREMIIAALKGISSIVITSPMSDFNKIINSWDGYSSKKPLELDF